MENAILLEQRNPQAARIIQSLTWIADGIGPGEREPAQALIYLAATSEKVFDSLARRSWLNNEDFQQAGPIVVNLEYISYEDQDAGQRLVEMPFLDNIQPHDVLAVESLSQMAYFYLPSLRRLLQHSAIRDGITDDEARIVGLLAGEYEAHPSLADTLLDPTATEVEERKITLPLAGDVTLAIIRTGSGAKRSMDLLEDAVRASESLMGEPFPAQYVPLLFTDVVGGDFGGSHNGNYIAILPRYDVADGNADAHYAGMVIAHEVAHYYWRGGQPWMDEGAAEFTAIFIEYLRTERPLEPYNYPCGHNQTIHYLEGRSYYSTDVAYICYYAAGERFFLYLYNLLDEETFWEGFRSLYLRTAAEKGKNAIQAGINEVRKAFANATTEKLDFAGQDIVTVINQRYEESVPAILIPPDPRPVVPELPSVYGWIDRAYISLTEGGPPAKTFSVSNLDDWVWLTLEYSHDYAGPPRELAFEVVEYYEDGFPYRRSSLAIRAERQYSGGVQWLSVGPGPQQEWAPGRHWINVYHEGRKVAEVAFEVTP